MRQLKQYAVEVVQRYSHGRYGKDFYFGMYVPGFSKKDAECVAIEMVSEMTFEEINNRCVDKGQKPWQIYAEHEHGADKPIGIEQAEFFFDCKAYIEN